MAKRSKSGKAVGRPSKLTPELQKQIIEYIARGNFIESAACHAGIARDTIRDWMRDGVRGKTPELAAFSAAVKEAQTRAEATLLSFIDAAAAQGAWQAAAWRLQHLHPYKYGKPSEDIKANKLMRAKLAAEIEVLKAKAANGGEDPSGAVNVTVLNYPDEEPK